MSISEILFSREIILALLVYILGVLVIEFLFYYLMDQVEDQDPTVWMLQKIALPLLHVFELIIFIVLAYPLLFGHAALPPLSEVMQASSGQMSSIVNILFLLGLLLPYIPFIGRKNAIVLPVQAIAASIVIFTWVAIDLGVRDINYWPGLLQIGIILVLALLSFMVAALLADRLGDWLDSLLEIHGSKLVLHRVTVLYFQLPVILIYTLSLGRQLP
jgi:hypothetical protein